MAGFCFKNKPAGNNFRSIHDDTGFLIKGHGNCNHTLLGKGSPLFEHTAPNIPYAFTIDEHPTGGDSPVEPAAGFIKFYDLSVFRQQDFVLGNPHFFGQPGVQYQMAVFTVNGDEILRFGQIDHQL